jgi:hypothetical protein
MGGVPVGAIHESPPKEGGGKNKQEKKGGEPRRGDSRIAQKEKQTNKKPAESIRTQAGFLDGELIMNDEQHPLEIFQP